MDVHFVGFRVTNITALYQCGANPRSCIASGTSVLLLKHSLRMW